MSPNILTAVTVAVQICPFFACTVMGAATSSVCSVNVSPWYMEPQSPVFRRCCNSLRNPDEVERRIRTKWNTESGEVEHRFREVEHEIREVERQIRTKWNIDSGDRERSSVA